MLDQSCKNLVMNNTFMYWFHLVLHTVRRHIYFLFSLNAVNLQCVHFFLIIRNYQTNSLYLTYISVRSFMEILVFQEILTSESSWGIEVRAFVHYVDNVPAFAFSILNYWKKIHVEPAVLYWNCKGFLEHLHATL